MATADEVLITVRTKGVKAAGADIDRTRKKLEGLGRAARGVGKDVRRATREMERLTAAASELSVADALGMSSRGRRSGSGGVEDARSSLARMRSDVGKTSSLLRQLEARPARRSPLAISEIQGSARQLQNFNRTAQQTVGAMRAVRGATSGSGSGSVAGAAGQRLDRPTGAPGRTGSRDQRVMDREGGTTRGRAREGASGRPATNRWGLSNALMPNSGFPAVGPSLAEPAVGTKRPRSSRTIDDALGDLRREYSLDGQLAKRRTKKQAETFDPAMVRLIDDLTQRDLKNLGGDGKAVATAFGEMSFGDRFKTVVTDPLNAAGAATTAAAVYKGVKNTIKKKFPRFANGARLARFGLGRAGLFSAAVTLSNDADKGVRNPTTGKTLEDQMWGRPGKQHGGIWGAIRDGLANSAFADLWRLRGKSDPNSTARYGALPVDLQPDYPYRPKPSAGEYKRPWRPAVPAPPVRNHVSQAQPMTQHPDPVQRNRVTGRSTGGVTKRTPTKLNTPRGSNGKPLPNMSSHPDAKQAKPQINSTGRATGGTVRPGELTLVGERGPEIARFPAGTQITSNRETRAKVAGAAAATRGRARDRVVRETPLNLSLDGQVFYRAVSRQTELVELRG